MRFAIPITNGRPDPHFGHCESFALIDVDDASKAIIAREDVPAPPHQPGLLPAWLGEKKANVVIAGGMGQHAQNLFAQQGISVVLGAIEGTPEELVQGYLAGQLSSGANLCDH